AQLPRNSRVRIPSSPPSPAFRSPTAAVANRGAIAHGYLSWRQRSRSVGRREVSRAPPGRQALRIIEVASPCGVVIVGFVFQIDQDRRELLAKRARLPWLLFELWPVDA